MRSLIFLAVLAVLSVAPSASKASEPPAAAAERPWTLATRADVPAMPVESQTDKPVVREQPAQWIILDPVTGEPAARPGGNPLTADLLNDALPGPDLRVEETPDGYLRIDTRAIKHWRHAELRGDGAIEHLCRQQDAE